MNYIRSRLESDPNDFKFHINLHDILLIKKITKRFSLLHNYLKNDMYIGGANMKYKKIKMLYNFAECRLSQSIVL